MSLSVLNLPFSTVLGNGQERSKRDGRLHVLVHRAIRIHQMSQHVLMTKSRIGVLLDGRFDLGVPLLGFLEEQIDERLCLASIPFSRKSDREVLPRSACRELPISPADGEALRTSSCRSA